jgi:hypothetical protein
LDQSRRTLASGFRPWTLQVSVVDALGNIAFISPTTMTVLPGHAQTTAGGGTIANKFDVYRVVVNVLR